MQTDKKDTAPAGLLVMDKPLGITSRRALDLLTKCFPKGTPLGHAGTLDPLATGVLVVCAGWTTRLVEYIQLMRKTYEATFTFGATSVTDDSEGPITPQPGVPLPTKEQIQKTVASFKGEIWQTPPAHSAARVDGKRAYRLARKGESALPPPKKVMIHDIQLGKYSNGKLEIQIVCGKGTYIRSLARDLGKELGTGGYVSSLSRTQIGPFNLENAVAPITLNLDSHPQLLPMDWALQDLTPITLKNPWLEKFVKGTQIPVPEISPYPSSVQDFAIKDSTGKIRGIGSIKDNFLCPRKIFPV